MKTKTGQVRAALMNCDAWYIATKKEIRQLTERTEILWFKVDDLVSALQEAEESEDTGKAEYCLQALLRCALAIQAEAEEARLRNA